MTFSRDFRVIFHYVGHVEIERASIITNANVDRQREFSLVTNHSYSVSTSSIWYIDSGALSHMTGAREMFSELSQAGIDVEVVLGDDTIVKAVGCGTIIFQRESMSLMTLRDILFVPGLKKNLISVSMIKDRGLRVTFLDVNV